MDLKSFSVDHIRCVSTNPSLTVRRWGCFIEEHCSLLCWFMASSGSFSLRSPSPFTLQLSHPPTRAYAYFSEDARVHIVPSQINDCTRSSGGPDESLLVRLHSRLKSQLWCIILNVMHVLTPGPAQRLRCLACMLRGHSVHYGFTGTVRAELKKEMGLRHVNGDYNHRKQEHNSLEYTDSSEMHDTRGAGRRRGGGREGKMERRMRRRDIC